MQPGDTVLHMGKKSGISSSFSYGRYVWKERSENGQKREYLEAAEAGSVGCKRRMLFE